MQQHPLQIIYLSLLADNTEVLAAAIGYGATEIIANPQSGTAEFLKKESITNYDTIKTELLAKSVNLNESKPIIR